ncbi:MAG: response regulator [Chitinispirillales bacterium]|jgi:signal transduction histidine kinase/CheY-like chemotaxis protein/HPt (histidine-containing phosphotransfer) domain-containing protein|nr:response regulator [Chitinispirillales bacterium]
MIVFSIQNSLLLLKRSYKQLLFLWLVFIVLIAACWLFIVGAMNDLLNRRAGDLLTNLESQVVNDQSEAETALRSASLNLETMIRGGYKEAEIRGYIADFNEYALAGIKSPTGVTGVYGVFNVYDNVFINTSGQSDKDPTRLEQLWYVAAVAAKGKIVSSLPYYDVSDGERKITFSRLIYDKKGKQAAVIGLDMRLSGLKNYIAGMRSSNNDCYGLVVDSSFNIIIGTVDETFGQPLSVLKSPDIYRMMAELNKGVNLYGYKTMDTREGNEAIIVYSRRIENGWHVGVVAPVKAYYEDVYERGVSIIFFGILLQLTLCFVILRIAAGQMKADERSDRKSNFLANMSHEIRTPMNAIIGFAELALREDIPPSAYEHIFTIKQAGANLLSIINDILDFSKIESGKFEIVPGDYLFSSLLNDVVSLIKMRATYAKLRFVVNVDSKIPNALYGDEVRVRQVLLNLLSNAVKYTDKGFVSLSINALYPKKEDDDDEDEEETGTKTDSIILSIEVTDSGKGIKSEDVDKLFKDFVQVDKERNKGVEGTGLGLAIINSILKAMGGKVSVSSEYGKGSTFTVTLPQRFRDAAAHASVDDKEGKNVLIYERRDLYANSIVSTIKRLGVNCAPVDGEASLDEKVASGSYNFIFTASALYDRTKNILQKHNSDAKVVLLTEFGDVIADKNVTILSMPAYSVTVANVLNGLSDNSHYGAKAESFTRFIAPDARVLVVDDTNTNLRVAEGLLSPYKMRVDTCRSGPDAIEAVQAERYDIVFMDHMMPGMDGLEATKRIRAILGRDDYYRKLPIIALTANAVSGAREMFLSEGLNDFISKPIDISKLKAVLEKWIPQDLRKSPTEVITTGDSGDDDIDVRKIKIDGVDVEKGLSISGGKGTHYIRTITMFYEDGFEKIKEIRNCMEIGDMQLYATHVHGLKSAAASIGAISVSEEAKALETAWKENNEIYINEHNGKFLMNLEALLHNIGKLLDDIEAMKKKTGGGHVDTELLKAELAKLRTAMENFDSETIDGATNTLIEYEQAEHFGEQIKSILQNVLIGEYDDALNQIDRLLEKLGMEVKLRED